MKKINAFVPVIIALAFAFFFIACGGEGPEDPVDNEPVDDAVVVDDTADSEIPDSDIQEPTDNEQPDDILTDEELTDADTTPVNCAEDETCKEICKNFLDRAGKWNRIESDLSDGSIDVVLSVESEQCLITVTGSNRWHWLGLDYPLEPFAPGYFYYLQKTEPERFAVDQKQEKDGEVLQTVTFVR